MALPNNTLQQVQTYQESSLAYLQNMCCFVSTANTKFKNFQDLEAQLGQVVTFDLPPRFVTNPTLVATFQNSQQRQHSLACDQAANTSYAFSEQQMIFNVRDYMEKFGKAAIAELATKVESNVASLAETAPYRFYGDGRTAINSFTQLANMMAMYRNYGAVNDIPKAYLSDLAVPNIVGSGLNQFVDKRNEEMANSWMVGDFARTKFYQSNLLPVHTAGTVGNDDLTLTVISTNDASGANITQITVSGAGASDADAIKMYDNAQFQDGVSGKTNLRFLHFIGHEISGNPVQIQMTANAASDGSGHIVLSITPALCAEVGNPLQNINTNVVAGMQLKVLPDHRCGLIVGGNALYLAMPRLGSTTPFPSSSKMDPDTGVSMRLYYGTLFGQNQQGFINDVIWGKTAVPEYTMQIVFPV